MTVSRAWSLQQAVFARLSAALATAGSDGMPVPVHDHARAQVPRLFVRIDGAQVVDESPKNCDRGRHVLRIHVFARPEDHASHGIGQREVKAVQATIHAALHRWSPFPGDGVFLHRSSDVHPDEDGLTQHGLSTFIITIGD